MMRIILVNPPPLFSDGSPNPIQSYYPPLGLLYIAAVLEEAGYEVSVCDASINNMDFNQIRNELHRGYDIIGIATFTGTRESAYLCASMAKDENREATVVLGGPHVTFLAEPTLRALPFVDVVVRGEGELTFLELVQRISMNKSYEDIRGISFRDENGVPCSNPSREVIENLDSLPFPAWHLIPMGKYFKASLWHEHHLKRPATHIRTSRGCPGDCIFCSSPTMWGKRVRRRKPENVVKEIEHLHREYGVNDLFLFDDTFTINKKWVMEFCDELIRSKVGTSWRCLGRVDTVDRDLLAAMKKAGCYHINYGVESGSQKTQETIRKSITVEQAAEGLRLTREAGLFVGADFIIGFPDETEEDMEQTLLFMKKNPVNNFALNIPWLFPGTALYRQALDEGKIDEMTWFKSFQPMKGTGVQPSFPIYVSNAFSSKEELLLKARKYASQVMTLGYLKRSAKFKRRTLPPLQFIYLGLLLYLLIIARKIAGKIKVRGGYLMATGGIKQRILDLALSVITRKKGKGIWESARTIRNFEKTWYENPARLKVYELIGMACKPGTALIDGGCGVGFDAERILARFKEISYTGIDASQKMIERCKEKFGHFPNAKFEKGDIFNLRFEDQSFDIVISCNGLIHVPNFTGALKELCRICSRYLILQFNYIDENGDYLQGLPMEEFNKRFLDKKSGMYFVYYNPQEIIDLCSNLGFKQVFKENFFLDKYNREAAVLQFVRAETER